jgi:V/A-type H+-transporting ATPase subunit D
VSALRGQPPGRAGLLWLRHRLGLAHRAATRLDQKLRILRTEQAAVALLLERTRHSWEQRCREAEIWLLRAALLDGQEGVRPPPGLPPAEVRIDWTTALGTTYPAQGSCTVPAPDPRLATVASAALVQATAAHRRALEAAVAHAVASTASRAIDAEVAATQRRLRGVQNRWIPRLTTAAAELRLSLDELELAEQVRLRRAVDQEGAIP